MTHPSIDLAAIQRAAKRIEPFIHRTPIITSSQLDAIAGTAVRIKAEHLQKVGAFKARGAHNAVLQADATHGFATHSSGNHGAALALAARNVGARALVVMPDNAPLVKRAAVASYGAEIIPCEPTQEAREATLASVLEKTGAHFVHPYEDPDVICGQGTAGLEIAEQCADEPPDAVVVPVGGGGLLSGVATAMKALEPGCEIIGAEPAGADDAQRGFRSGNWEPQRNPQTIADGLRTSLGHPNFALIRESVDDILTVSDEATIEAMKACWQFTKQIIEPSAAVALAVVLTHRERFKGRRVVVIATGGNLDLQNLPWS